MLLITAFIINGSLALFAILLHYEALFQLDKLLPRIAHIAPRFRVLIGVGAIFMAHVVEIWLFAFGYFFTLQFPVMGGLVALPAPPGAVARRCLLAGGLQPLALPTRTFRKFFVRGHGL